MLIPILLLLLGLIMLLAGGDTFIKGAASLARKWNISPIVIGLTVVAFGTSAAELVVNIFAAVQGTPDLAIGNILGSNISNILLVLGISAIIYPISVKQGTIWKEIPLGIMAVVVLFILSADVYFGNGESSINILTRGDGLILLAFFIIFMYYTYGLSKVEGEKEEDVKTYSWSSTISFVLLGLGGLVLGGKLLVDNGTIIARLFGMSELFIGLTVVAIGTSLPELAASGIAAYRHHDDLAIGNVVGSNIFNVFWVLGLTPLVSPIPVNSQANTDVLVAILAATLLFAFMFVGHKHKRYKLRRWQGVVFVLLYVAYLVFIGMRG
ncbi:MAG: calcium/sodium antiporter [Candidatus Magasanikbacteria bacterium]|jgi:cation:H+ antiporter|nr:calcium/sodium antiporter [Candidatus Magasanikbacteria bacterium]MBT4314857.1 calcium/sodium antiporter [Candidatus Magasanikbacteria bacterium]MBT4546756.1 calcium/sodium antiporter [Candidatus Magasanikbacteria bacterium]MBT6819635.1 calcium/sodium antiporter [Candidatus Magasanikbacteria bacterium]